jgi:hypothetical protein
MEVCARCGQPEYVHHAFIPVQLPKGCVCLPSTWDEPQNIPDVCKEHLGLRDVPCECCSHDYECHSQHPREIHGT